MMTDMEKMELDSVPEPTADLTELQQHIQKLFNTHLCDGNILAMHQKLQVFRQSSFYLDLQPEEHVWSLVNQQRLEAALGVANSHVRLVLALLDLLLEEIVLSCQDLQNFLQQSEQGQVDTQLLTAARSTVRKLHEDLKDFEARFSCNLGPLYLGIRLIPNAGPQPPPPVTAMLSVKMPVYFDRLRSQTKSTTVSLFWISGTEITEDSSQFFEVQAKILHPMVGENGLCDRRLIHGLSWTFQNLTPDRVFWFSVKRMHRINLVYTDFIDTITLKTLTA